MASANQQSTEICYQFRDFTLDAAARTLRRGGSGISLTPKEFETLLALVEVAGNAVAKDDLARRIWPDTFVGDASLARNISVLRKQLGQDAIGTLPKHGYRFEWAVSVVPREPSRTNGSQPIKAHHVGCQSETNVATTGNAVGSV